MKYYISENNMKFKQFKKFQNYKLTNSINTEF